MKKNIIIILLSAILLIAATVSINTITGDLVVTGNLIVDTVGSYTKHIKKIYADACIYTPPYAKATFKDSSVTITGGTNVIVSSDHTGGIVFVKYTASAITWSRDTAIISIAGAYIIDFALYGSGNNGTDWELKRATKSGGITTYGVGVCLFSTDGAGNYNGTSFNAFPIDLKAGDKVWFVLSRIGGTGNFTAKSGRFQPRLFFQTN